MGRRKMIVCAGVLALAGALGACAALVPGYAETQQALAQATAEAQSARQVALSEAERARQAGDMGALVAALERVSVTLQAEIDARAAQAKHEVESAGTAGSGLLGGAGGVAGVLGLVLAEVARRRATAATVATQGPSRAQGELDRQWDELSGLKAELAALKAAKGAAS